MRHPPEPRPRAELEAHVPTPRVSDPSGAVRGRDRAPAARASCELADAPGSGHVEPCHHVNPELAVELL